jgi:branched-subunit amino acid aminotransferase/4-amino-4-deoxychorismate lyase
VKVYIDGRLYAEEDAKIRVLSAGVRDGQALRERFVCRAGKFFHLDSRLEQLRVVGEELDLTIDWDMAVVKEALAVTYDLNGLDGLDALLELIIAAGDKENGTSVVVTAEKWPPNIVKEAIALAALENFPMDGELLLLERNLLGRTGTRIARAMAREKEADEALLFDGDGCISACTGGEIFAVREQCIWIPEIKRRPIIGQLAIELFDDLEVKTNVQKLKLRDLQAASECFLLNDLCEVVPIGTIGGKACGDGNPGVKTRSFAKDLADKLSTESHEAFHL